MSNEITIATTEQVNQKDLYEKIQMELPNMTAFMTWIKAYKYRTHSSLNIGLLGEKNVHHAAFVMGQEDVLERILNLASIAAGELKKMADEELKAAEEQQKQSRKVTKLKK